MLSASFQDVRIVVMRNTMLCRGSEMSCFVHSFPETYLESTGKAQVTIPNKVQTTKLYGAGRDTLQCYDLLT